MSSERQILANRINAKQSTGPRTLAGKARVAMNAFKHGLTGRDVVLPEEDPDAYDSFRAGLLEDLNPQGALAAALAEKLVADLWRQRRIPILEAKLYRRGQLEVSAELSEKTVRRYESTQRNRIQASLEKKQVTDCDRQAHEAAVQKLARERAELDDPSLHATRVLENHAPTHANLWRHEAALLRSMLRTLHELHRLKAEQAGQAVPVPEVVDVDVSIGRSNDDQQD
jgi:hypothetical protein